MRSSPCEIRAPGPVRATTFGRFSGRICWGALRFTQGPAIGDPANQRLVVDTATAHAVPRFQPMRAIHSAMLPDLLPKPEKPREPCRDLPEDAALFG